VTIKVICMGSGQMGMAALQEVIKRPELQLVGLHAYSDWKAGMDAADIINAAKELIGSIDEAKKLGFDPGTPLEKTGVLATCSFEDIVAMDADLVIYTTLGAGEDLPENDEQVRDLLRSGKGVITPTGYTFRGPMGTILPKVLKMLVRKAIRHCSVLALILVFSLSVCWSRWRVIAWRLTASLSQRCMTLHLFRHRSFCSS